MSCLVETGSDAEEVRGLFQTDSGKTGRGFQEQDEAGEVTLHDTMMTAFDWLDYVRLEGDPLYCHTHPNGNFLCFFPFQHLKKQTNKKTLFCCCV